MVVTKENLSIFKDTQQSKLVQKINLDDIQRIDQHYHNTFCFDIIVNQLGKGNSLKTGPLSFCSNSKNSFNVWLASILEFKQCRVNIQTVKNTKILVDFKRINALKKNKSKENILSDLFYDGDDKVYRDQNSHDRISENMKKALKLMKTNIKRANIAKRMIRRKFAGRMSNTRTFRDSFLRKEMLMKTSMEKKIALEREKEFKILRNINKPKELGLIMNVVKKINEVKVCFIYYRLEARNTELQKRT
jgi:hypothetical protein